MHFKPVLVPLPIEQVYHLRTGGNTNTAKGTTDPNVECSHQSDCLFLSKFSSRISAKLHPSLHWSFITNIVQVKTSTSIEELSSSTRVTSIKAQHYYNMRDLVTDKDRQ